MTLDGQGAGADEVVRSEHLERICLRNLLSSTTEAVYFKDRNCRFLLVSNGVVQHHIERQRRFGAQEDEDMVLVSDDLVGKSDMDLFDGPLAQEWIAEEQRIMDTGEPVVDVLERDTSSDNADAWFQTSKAPLRDDDGTIIGTFGISRDVTARVKAEQEVVRREAQLRAVLDSSPDAIACYNEELRYEMVNAKAAAMLGTSAEKIVGKTDAELGRPPEIVAPLMEGLRRVLETKEMCEAEYSADAGGASSWWQVRMVPHMAPDGVVTGVVTATRDLTELKAAQSVLAHQALHDPLTGAANRLALVERLSHALDDLERNPGLIALLFIDLDDFKLINDARGHDVGDELLVEVASRLSRAARQADTVARFGGDEFVVLLERLSATEEARLVAARVLDSFSEPFGLAGDTFTLTASIGVVVASDPRTDPGVLLRHADTAMYRAKEKGRGRIEISNPAAATISVSG